MSGQEIGEKLRALRSTAALDTPVGVLHLRGLTGKERSEYFSQFKAAGFDPSTAEHRLVATCWSNEDGTPVYANGEALLVVMDWDPEIVSKASALVLQKSGLSKDAAQESEKN